MAQRTRKAKGQRHRQTRRASQRRQYERARALALSGDYPAARPMYHRLDDRAASASARAIVKNDLAVLSAADGDIESAVRGFKAALTLDPACEPARLNLALVEADRSVERAALKLERGTEAETSVEHVGLSVERSDEREATASESVCASDAPRATRDAQRFPKGLLLMVTYNRLDYTRLALDAALQLDYPNLEIVVWDNNSTDGTVEYLRKRLARVRDVRLELSATNAGVVHPMNAVWGGSQDAELLVKIDNDTLVPADLIRRLVQCHVASDRFGVLSGFHFRSDGEAIAPQRDIVTVDGLHVLRQQYVGGCAVMIRRQVYERFGSIPEKPPSPCPLPPQRGERVGVTGAWDQPFLESGWTTYQRRLNDAGFINGYPWPPIHVDHMEDTRSPHCIRSSEHEAYKHAMRGMSLDEFTQELCVWRPH